MTGFIVTPTTATAVLDGIAQAQTSRGLSPYWTCGSYQIFTGTHAGKRFLPFDEQMMATVLREDATPMDFPETTQLLTLLGGLDSRVELAASAIVDPDAEV